jgi:hypothetical protein
MRKLPECLTVKVKSSLEKALYDFERKSHTRVRSNAPDQPQTPRPKP